MADAQDAARQALVEVIGFGTGAVKLARDVREFVIDVLVSDALLIAGLEVEPFAPLTERVLADALAKKIEVEYGLNVGDLLDAESVKRSLKAEALRIVGERLGVTGGVGEIARALKAEVSRLLIEAARAGDEDVLAALSIGARAVDDAARAARVEDSKAVKNLTQAGEKNRQRQERYRSRHKRVWVPR